MRIRPIRVENDNDLCGAWDYFKEWKSSKKHRDALVIREWRLKLLRDMRCDLSICIGTQSVDVRVYRKLDPE